MPAPLHVVVFGPESTGKTTLARELAEHYGTAWIPEYLREYLDVKGAGCTPTTSRPWSPGSGRVWPARWQAGIGW